MFIEHYCMASVISFFQASRSGSDAARLRSPADLAKWHGERHRA